MADSADTTPGETANHIYLMPFPRKEDYALLVQPVPPEGEIEEKFSEIEKTVEALIKSKKIGRQLAGTILGEFILESDLVKVINNKYDVVIHYPSQLEELDAFERFKECLIWLKEKNVVQFLMTIGGGTLGTLFGQWYLPVVLGPHIAKGWRETRAYDVLLVAGDRVVEWESPEGAMPGTKEQDTGRGVREVRFETEGRLTQILDWLTLPDGKRRRHNSLIRYCGMHEDLKEFEEFYRSRAL